MGFNRSAAKMNNAFQQATALSQGQQEYTATARPAYNTKLKFNKWAVGMQDRNILMAEVHKGANDYDWLYHINIHELPNPADPKNPHRFPCLRMLGKKCPCCDRKDMLDTGDNYDEIKGYLPKERVVMYMQEVKGGVGGNEPLVYEGAARQKGNGAFVQKLTGAALAMSNGAGVIPFADPDNGKIVCVQATEDNFNGHKFASPNTVFFKDRTEQIPDALYEKCPAFTDLVNFSTEQEMQDALDGNYTYKASTPAPQQAQAPVAPAPQQQFQQPQQQVYNNPTQPGGFGTPAGFGAPAPQGDFNLSESDFRKVEGNGPTQFQPATPAGFGPAPQQPAAPAGFGMPNGFTNRFGN